MSQHHRKCSKCGKTRAEDVTVTYHRFPNPGKANITKACAWAKYVWPNEDWSSVESLYSLHVSHKVLCGRHFHIGQFYDNKRQKLSKFAVPEQENLPNQLQKEKLIEVHNEELDEEINEIHDGVQNEKLDELRDLCADAESIKDTDASMPDEVFNEVHKWFKCNVCLGEISGFRYVCVQCSDYDMCARCEARGEHPHHYVLRVPSKAHNSETKSILLSLRRFLTASPAVIKDELVELKEEDDMIVEYLTDANPLEDTEENLTHEEYTEKSGLVTEEGKDEDDMIVEYLADDNPLEDSLEGVDLPTSEDASETEQDQELVTEIAELPRQQKLNEAVKIKNIKSVQPTAINLKQIGTIKTYCHNVIESTEGSPLKIILNPLIVKKQSISQPAKLLTAKILNHASSHIVEKKNIQLTNILWKKLIARKASSQHIAKKQKHQTNILRKNQNINQSPS